MLALSKPVFAHVAGRPELIGVAATGISLKLLSRFSQSIHLPVDGKAFVMEWSDELVATSLSEIPYVRPEGCRLKRQPASDSASPMMTVAARSRRGLIWAGHVSS
jgi:hypothetical protein